jgi:hypothetical protein
MLRRARPEAEKPAALRQLPRRRPGPATSDRLEDYRFFGAVPKTWSQNGALTP